jgi:hypothetical protein
MSEEEVVKGRMTDEELRTFYRELRDGLTLNIGKVETMIENPATATFGAWLKYILEHIRYQYELLEGANVAVRDIHSVADNLDSKIREFDKHKPTLEFIESTEMTDRSQVSQDDQ